MFKENISAGSPCFAFVAKTPRSKNMKKTDAVQLIPNFGFSCKNMDADKNYEYWKNSVNTIFDIDVEGRKDLPAFYADMKSYSMGSILFGFSRSAPQRFSRSATTIARSGADHILVQLYMRGGFSGIAGSLPIEVLAGDICVLDCVETLETLSTDFENLTLVIPRAMLESRFATPESLHGLVLKRSSAMTQVLALHLAALFKYAPQMTIRECENISAGTVALIVACLQGVIEAHEAPTGSGPVSILIRIRRYIDDNLASADLNAGFIADHFGLSRASLYRLFEPLGGVADYIRNKRLRRVFFDLKSSDYYGKHIGVIARNWGFNNESTFNRAFKIAYGVTPAAVRKATQFEAPVINGNAATDDETSTIGRWMREIVGDGGPTRQAK